MTGLASLVWFLVRVIPKPSRAGYPCQRAAAPVASGFIVWLIAVFGSRALWQSARRLTHQRRWVGAALCGMVALAGAAFALSKIPLPSAIAAPEPHGPIGTGQGIHPGRVVWVHAPEATDWSGYESSTHWYDEQHTDLSVAEEMTSEAIRSLAGEKDDAAAWDAIFRYFNDKHGKGDAGYVAGEKIAMKINLTTCNARGGMIESDYDKKATRGSDTHWRNTIDNSPQMLISLLRQLVYVAGVAPEDISLGDTTGYFANHLYEPIHAEFPDVVCFDNDGELGSGRTRVEFSSQKFYWSSAEANQKLRDYVPAPFAEADYFINYAVLKTHSVGVTLCAKNHYGSLLRCPDGYLRDEGKIDYFNTHDDLPGFSGADGMGKYRPLVDLMGHKDLGGKTLLYLVDGLFSGEGWEGFPFQWQMAPFGTRAQPDWPNSLFASQDPVAIDSVCYDFLLTERPDEVAGSKHPEGGPQDYLHEAALADNPPSGTIYDPEADGARLASLGIHEHWNNSTDKQYSRNLGAEDGIELLQRQVGRPEPRVALQMTADETVVAWRDSIGYGLEVAEDLGNPDGWQAVQEDPEYVEGMRVIRTAPSSETRFYRLKK